MRPTLLILLTVSALVSGPAALAHLAPTVDEVRAFPGEGHGESCGGEAPALTICSTAQHLHVVDVSHVTIFGPTYTGVVSSKLFALAGSGIEKVDGGHVISCAVQNGALRFCTESGSAESVRGSPFGHTCESTRFAAPEEPGGLGFWMCGIQHT